jgi:outer membrane protein TolC
MLDTSLARSPDAPIPELDIPVSDAEPPAATAIASAALANRPELRAGRAEVVRSEAEVSAMESMYSPMAMVRTGPSYTMADGAGWMVMVGVSIPLWRGKLRAGVNEARAMADMAGAELEAMRRMIGGEATAARERVAAARERYLALSDGIVPRARQAIAPNLTAYAANQTPLVSAIEAAQALWEAQRELAMARADLGLAWARLHRTTGDTP